LSVHIPVLAVIGRRHSGKTTVVEGLVSGLVKKGFRVATAKHVRIKEFSMDTEGKDTWRHSGAGANPVIMVSDKETVIKIGDGAQSVSLDTMAKIAEEYETNVMVLEGFSSIVLTDKRVGKIICVRNQNEYKEFMENAKGEVLAYCSVHTVEKQVLDIRRNLPVMAEKAASFVERRQKILEILKQLAALDCGKCGKATCWELAEAIYKGEAKLDECVPLKAKPELRTTITVKNAEVSIQPFVAEIVRKTILGMVSTLKGVNIEGEEQIHIDIT
jgi:molybdopterin-guanine dinucleotide biosynthesis protein B